MGQNLTDSPSAPEDNVKHKLYIDFVAVRGLMVTDDGKLHQVSAETFAQSIGVTRQTLYNWQASIPNFWEKVAARIPTLYSQRAGVIYKGLLLRSAKGDARQAEIILNQLEQLRPRVEKAEIKHEFPQPVLANTTKEPDVRRNDSDQKDQSS